MAERRPLVTVYGRAGCHLCDDATKLIESLRTELPAFELKQVDIERDDDLHARMLERIPVVEVDGKLVAELEPDRSTVASAIFGAATMAPDEHGD